MGLLIGLAGISAALILAKRFGLMNRYTDVFIVPLAVFATALIVLLFGDGKTALIFAGLGVTAILWSIFIAHRAPARRTDLETEAPAGAVPPKGWSTHLQAFLAMMVFKTVPRKDLEGPLNPEVRKYSDLVFGTLNSRNLTLNLYEPKDGKSLRPAILFVHGGSWKMGDKDQLHLYANHFARAGYVCVCMEYRLMQEAPFPAALEDVLTAVRWTRANAATYGIDPDRLAISGNSAGGHLAMMAAFAANDPQWDRSAGHADQDERVKALINIYGGYDLTADWVRKESHIRTFVNAEPHQIDKFRNASPRYHLTTDAPPTLILHGTLDLHAPVQQSDALAEDLKRLGIPYRYGRLDGWAHIFDATEPGFEWSIRWMTPFLAEVL